MNNFLLWLAAIVIVVLGALFAVPMLVDWNGYRGTFEREMTKVIGREIRIGGDVALRLLPTPYLSMEKVRIADASGRFDTPLLRLERFTVWLSTTPLVRGQIEAREMEFQRPELRLAFDDAGRGNWSGLGSGADFAFLPSSVALSSARVIDGSLQFVLPADRGTLLFTEVNGEVAADSLQGPFRFKGSSSFNGAGREIRIDTDVFAAGGILPVRGSMSRTGAGDTYAFDGMIAGLDGMPRAEGKLEARLPLGTAVDGPAIELNSQLVATIEGLNLQQISLVHLHKERMQKVEGEASVGFGSRLDIALRLGGRNLDLDQLLASRPAEPANERCCHWRPQ